MEKTIITNSDTDIIGFLKSYIDQADLRITNLECPITRATQPISKTGPALKAIPESERWLSAKGFNLVTLANNHIMDYGPDGLSDTIAYLDQAGISYLGAGKNFTEASKAFRFEQDGVSISILNFAENEWSTTFGDYPGASPIDPVRNFASIQREKAVSDHVIIISHGGHEMYTYPSPRMRELYRFYIDAGASSVINHHTHCISGWENYNQGFIHYSLGNFLFDHATYRSGIWNYGAAVNLHVTKEKIEHRIYYFKQGSEEMSVSALSSEDKAQIEATVSSVNQSLQDEKILADRYEEYTGSVSRMYRTFLEPLKNKYINALQNRNLFPRMYGWKYKRLLLNLVRCESHRDILKKILGNDIQNPK